MKHLVIILILLSIGFSAHAEREVTLRFEVSVSGRSVLLKDLVQDSSVLTAEEADLIIMDSPTRGFKNYTGRMIAARMRIHKQLLDIDLLSPKLIKVMRKTDKRYVETVRNQLLKDLKEQSQWKGQTLDLQFSADDISKINDMNGAEVELISQMANEKMDRLEMKVSFKDLKGDLGVVEIKAHLRRKIFIVQLSRSVPKGYILQKDDLRIAQVWSNGKDEKYATQFKECVGYQISKDMAASSKVLRSSLGEPYYTRKGDIISVYSKIGNIKVFIHAQALLDGKRGQVIRARNTKSGRQVDVRMVSPLVAEIN